MRHLVYVHKAWHFGHPARSYLQVHKCVETHGSCASSTATHCMHPDIGLRMGTRGPETESGKSPQKEREPPDSYTVDTVLVCTSCMHSPTCREYGERLLFSVSLWALSDAL
ncbi:hypothetical protein DPEC_G00328350 [Dallia pectoralis]|uniref:Uncharacterized protein n=1 Tax=Dallia pectoralis TaxID=75939 RepID=A0ACC2F8F8_DALPE|nr:hypothetical protein DPEC_G00328350 [Dallia pectoralis]